MVRTRPTSFLRKTFSLLSNPSLLTIVRWSEDGTSFSIINSADFCEAVLPLYFKHNNLASFIRQLNMYDFRKIKAVGAEHAFQHPLFVKAMPELLINIKRKACISGNSEGHDSVPEERKSLRAAKVKYQYNSLKSEVSQIKREVKSLALSNRSLVDEVQAGSAREAEYHRTLIVLMKWLGSQHGGLPYELHDLQSRLGKMHGTTKRSLSQHLCTSSLEPSCIHSASSDDQTNPEQSQLSEGGGFFDEAFSKS
jgi:hypothetical protein